MVQAVATAAAHSNDKIMIKSMNKFNSHNPNEIVHRRLGVPTPRLTMINMERRFRYCCKFPQISWITQMNITLRAHRNTQAIGLDSRLANHFRKNVDDWSDENSILSWSSHYKKHLKDFNREKIAFFEFAEIEFPSMIFLVQWFIYFWNLFFQENTEIGLNFKQSASFRFASFRVFLSQCKYINIWSKTLRMQKCMHISIRSYMTKTQTNRRSAAVNYR